MAKRRSGTEPVCPQCGGSNVASIRYGKQAMTPALEQVIARGEVVLGGCAREDRPNRHCNQCRHRWREGATHAATPALTQGKGLLWIALLLDFLVMGVPLWLLPYSKVTLPNAFLHPGLAVLGITALLLAFHRVERFWKVALWVTCALLVALLLRDVVDIARDSTSHNLLPFEFIIAFLVGAAVTFPAAGLGGLLAWFKERRSA